MTTTAVRVPAASTRKVLHVGLWLAQVLLALAFFAGGVMKVTTPIDELAKMMTWAADVPWLPRFIGVTEIAGALGLVLPSLTRIAPKLTPLAALGLLTIMVLALGLHVTRGEPFVANIVLGGIAAFIAWGRWRAAPIAPRT